jgi:mannose-6-phosphate isomerase-like protein (cupin superfamily)
MQTTAPDIHARATFVPAGADEVCWLDSTVDIKLTAAQTDGHVGMWLWFAPLVSPPPLHVHHREDEQFLVVDGQIRFFIGEQRFDAQAGDLVFLPREVPHAYLVTSETSRGVGTATPGGFESFFAELGTPVEPGAPAAPPPAIDAMAAAAGRRGIEILGPPPTLD